jgi:hypothetical protein
VHLSQLLDSALGPTLARDPPRRERLGEAPETLRPKVLELEQAAHEAARRLADPGAANAWRFGVSPTTASLRAAPWSIGSPAPAIPVAILTLAASAATAAKLVVGRVARSVTRRSVATGQRRWVPPPAHPTHLRGFSRPA